jgi:hypothetical protein
MGNNQSNVLKSKQSFGSVNPTNGSKARPGYYFGRGNVVYQGVPIDILPNEAGFQKLNYGYLKSNQRVFYNGVPINGANPKTFHIIPRKEIPEQFKKLNCVLGKDFQDNKARLYHFGTLIHID